jgi:hypothetical protein
MEAPKLKVTVNNHTWTLCREHDKFFEYSSNWTCPDGDGVNLYIEKDKGGFELTCFSGITGSSKIFIDYIDFGTLLRKSNNENVVGLSYIEQCITIAEYFCYIFCDWFETSEDNIVTGYDEEQNPLNSKGNIVNLKK